MSKIRFYAAMLTGKMVHLGLRLLGRNASYLPGKAALMVCKDFMGYLQLPEKVICVTGTNGKTTVSNLLTNILRDCGYSVTNNSLGSNVQAGIAAALMEDAAFSGKIKKDIAVLEVDERSSLLIYPYIKPDYLICNNIMRDSIKRNAHTDFISFILNKAIPSGTRLILNADDIICSHLGLDNPDRTYFGISAEAPESSEMPFLRDIVYCPECGEMLKADYVRYNHIGRVYCPRCQYRVPEPDFTVSEIDRVRGTFTICHAGENQQYKLVNDNITNLYNFCAVITVLNKLEIPYEKIRRAIESVEIVKSRHDEIVINGRKFTIILAKGQNPFACTGVMRYTASCSGTEKTVLISLDDMGDNNNNSENVSWVFDTDYTYLADPSISRVIFLGKRCHDYYLRALMAGVSADRMSAVETWQEGVGLIDLATCKDLYLLYDPYRGAEMKQIREHMVARMKGENGNEN